MTSFSSDARSPSAMLTGVVVLAAGAGQRFGGVKQLALINGRPMLEHSLRVACAVPNVAEVRVVLGANAPAVRERVRFGCAVPIACPDWKEGIAASLRCGIQELASCEQIVILLGDQPLITLAAIAAVLDLVGSAPAARAVYGGRPGHPVVVRAELFDRLLGLRGDRGAAALLRNAGAVQVECGAVSSDLDVDTRRELTAVNLIESRRNQA